MDLILRNARLIGAERETTDIGIIGGKIVDIRPGLAAEGETVDLEGRLVSPGLIETHIHLDKSCILGRCEHTTKRSPHLAMERVSAVKHTMTVEDVIERASATIEKCISHGVSTRGVSRV